MMIVWAFMACPSWSSFISIRRLTKPWWKQSTQALAVAATIGKMSKCIPSAAVQSFSLEHLHWSCVWYQAVRPYEMPDTVLCIDALRRLWGWGIRQICLCTCSHSSALLQMWVIIYVENDSERIRETRRCLQLIARTPASAGSRIFLYYDTIRATDSSNECKTMQSRS